MSVLAVDAATFGSTTHPILQTVTVFLQTLSLDTMANSLGLLPDLFLFKMVPFDPIFTLSAVTALPTDVSTPKALAVVD